VYALLLSRNPNLAGVLRALFRAAGLRLVMTDAAATSSVVPPQRTPPDLIVLDCSRSMPDDGVWCQRLLRSTAAPVLIIHVKDVYPTQTPRVTSMPVWWMSSSMGLDEMVGFLRTVRAALPPAAQPRRGRRLSRRQEEVVRLMSPTSSITAIAVRLQAHPGTVKRHIQRAKEKLGASTEAELMEAVRKLLEA
jgi:DNA-binding NarL/FixJ family response regulator